MWCVSGFLFQRNPKMELSKTDLLKLLSYLEGELQARDIVIATLKVRYIDVGVKFFYLSLCDLLSLVTVCMKIGRPWQRRAFLTITFIASVNSFLILTGLKTHTRAHSLSLSLPPSLSLSFTQSPAHIFIPGIVIY
jgi:hypothetical protein